MEEQPVRAGADRRRSQRISARSLVEIRLPDWEVLRSVYTVNLSLGGMRLSLGARAAVGTPIDIILTLPNGERLPISGIVAHLGPDGSGDIGVRFDALPTRTRSEIERYVTELTAGRTPPSRPMGADIPSGVLIKKTT
jgi:Tfp pilus assembly protein PilZ